mgnify:CR=1 FL=1
MKRIFQLLTLALVLAGSTAFSAEVYVDAEVSPEISTDTVAPNTNFTIDFYFHNATSPATNINGYSCTWRIYSPDSVTQITYRDLGGVPFGVPASINPVDGSGWRPSFTPGAFYWSALNSYSMFNMDGILPDTFNHTTIGITTNWPASDNTRRMRFQIGAYSEQEGTVCIDSINYAPNPTYNWLWDKAATWNNGQSYCFVINDPTNPVGDNGVLIPLEYSLKQNYPNPFNPATTITYSLEKQSYVELSIYNVLGQKIKTLVNKEQPADVYNVIWNGDTDEGKAAASGIYFYEIKAGEYQNTRKMMLLK